MYVITGGAVAPPRVLRASLLSRTVRASMRTFGLEALAALLRSLAPDGEVSTSRGAPSAMQVSNRGFGIATGARCAVLQCFRVASTVYGMVQPKKRQYYRTLFSCLASPHLTVVTRMASCLPHIAGIVCSTSSRGCKVCTPQHLRHASPHDISNSYAF